MIQCNVADKSGYSLPTRGRKGWQRGYETPTTVLENPSLKRPGGFLL